MKKIASIIEYFDTSICDIKKSNLNELAQLDKKITLSYECLIQFRAVLINEGFLTNKDEITFFKYRKPYIQGRLKYYKSCYKYLLKQPFGSIEQQLEYINKELNDIDTDNCLQLNMVKYLRLKQTGLDEYYFLRENIQFDIFTDTSQHSDDPSFSTNYDYIVSNIITSRLLQNYYSKELDILNKNDENIVVSKPEVLKGFCWTGKKIELNEFIISMCESPALNNGAAELNKFKKAMEYIFDIELGNIHKVFDQIRSREKDQTKFLDSLKKGLIEKINKKY